MSKKLAIQINNKREFDLLMKHYEDRAWQWANDTEPNESRPNLFPANIQYHDKFKHGGRKFGFDDYEIISFANFASLIGIKTDVITIELENDTIATVSKHGVSFSDAVSAIFLPGSGVVEIHTAFQSLQ